MRKYSRQLLDVATLGTPMKKIVTFTLCALLLCGGLLCLHLVAQTRIENTPVPAKQGSLIDSKPEEWSERDLLERKVVAYRHIADQVARYHAAGSPAGNASRLAESHANLAAAEIELYRHTGEQVKLRVALESQIEALTDRLRAVTVAYEAATCNLADVSAAEIQLLNVLLERKREQQ